MRYKLSKTKAKEFAIRLQQECEKRSFLHTNYPIRLRCYIRWYSLSQNKDLEGIVIKSTYGGGRDLHYFTIEWDGNKYTVRGKNLYPYILVHVPGIESLELKKQQGENNAI